MEFLFHLTQSQFITTHTLFQIGPMSATPLQLLLAKLESMQSQMNDLQVAVAPKDHPSHRKRASHSRSEQQSSFSVPPPKRARLQHIVVSSSSNEGAYSVSAQEVSSPGAAPPSALSTLGIGSSSGSACFLLFLSRASPHPAPLLRPSHGLPRSHCSPPPLWKYPPHLLLLSFLLMQSRLH